MSPDVCEGGPILFQYGIVVAVIAWVIDHDCGAIASQCKIMGDSRAGMGEHAGGMADRCRSISIMAFHLSAPPIARGCGHALPTRQIPEGHPLWTRASVGIGNVKLHTAANIRKGQACDQFGDCTSVKIHPLQVRNWLGFDVDIRDPYEPEVACSAGGLCGVGQPPSEDDAYVTMTRQLLDWEMNIEYIAANLEAGAQRALAKGLIPSAFNAASWHLRGVQSDAEIKKAGWNSGGAVYILDDIPTALKALNLTSSWSSSLDPQYMKYAP